jgi:hypothetical protein
MSVSEIFEKFCTNLSISQSVRSVISTRYKKITQRLNRDYYNSDSEDAHSKYVGSYGRGTAINSISDFDIIFELPYYTKSRFDTYRNNGQSALLQEIKNSIKNTYSTTDVGGDGQVVVVTFSDNIIFEVVPTFKQDDGSFIYPDSNYGGSWKITNPSPEIEEINRMDNNCNNNLKKLCKMARAWKNKWNILMGGLLIDTLAYNFFKENVYYKDKSYTYYDWLSRDFFKYLSIQNIDQQYWFAVGSNQKVYKKGDFQRKAKECYELSLEAIDNQDKGYVYTTDLKWKEIYGAGFSGQ